MWHLAQKPKGCLHPSRHRLTLTARDHGKIYIHWCREAQRGCILTSFRGMPTDSAQTDLKQVGDEAFKRGAFQEAVDAYGQALSVSAAASAPAAASDPYQRGALLANRCLALLKLGGQAHRALADAQQACKLRPRWGKAHLRLGQVGWTGHRPRMCACMVHCLLLLASLCPVNPF